MSWLGDGLDTLSHFDADLKLMLAGVFAFAESGLGVGMFIPGETAVVILSAGTDGVPALTALFVTVAVCSSAGDHVGYLLGRRFGGRLRETRLVRRMGRDNWDRANALLHKHGAAAVFFTRLIPVVRTLTPAVAGVSEVKYRRFLPASLLGAVTWSALYVCGGALAAVSVKGIETVLGGAAWALFAGLGVGLVVFLFKRRRARARVGNTGESEES